MLKFFKMKKTMSLGIAALLLCSLMFPSVAMAESTSSNGAVIDLTANAKTENLKSGQEIIQILATADSHGRFLPYDYAINSADTQGSLAQIATAVNQLRNENPNNTILVDAGDTIQDNSASLFLNDTLNPMMLAMNEIGYDAITFGNHEFNYGVPVLKNIAKQFNGAALCGNVYDKDGSRIAAPYTIVERSGVKIGIIGMVTPNITRWDSANLQEYKVTNPVDETKVAIAELKSKNVDLILAVEHMGETGEYNEPGSGANEVLDQCPEIDAFVVAHFHNRIVGDYFYNHNIYTLNATTGVVTATAMNGTTSSSTMEAYNEAKAKGTIIVEPNKWGKTLSQVKIKVTKNDAGKYVVQDKATDITSAAYDMTNKTGVIYQADQRISEVLQPYNQRAIEDANTLVGTLKGGDLAPANEINGIPQARLQPSAMVDLINKVQMYYGEQIANKPIDISSAAVFKDTQNIKEGSFKKCDTANIYQFDNTLYVLKITGSQLKKYMEWSANYYNKYNSEDLTLSFNSTIPGYNYDIFYGIKYNINVSKDSGNRIENLTKMDGTPVKDSDEFLMTVNNYRAGTQLLKAGTVFGPNDSLPVLVGKSEETLGLGDGRVRDLIGRYVQEVKGGTITPECSNNWKVIGNDWNTYQRSLAVKYINDGSIALKSNNSQAVTWTDVKKVMESSGNKVIDIISFNDFHGNLAEDASSTGKNVGMSKLVKAINEYKASNPNTIVVAGGDNYQGSAMSNLTYGAPVSAMLKQLGVVASSVGNHEFDWGVSWISKWSKEGGFDFLASNIYNKATGQPVEWAKPYKIVTVDGLKVGFVGLTTPETAYKTKPDNVADLEFRDTAVAAKEWADKLKSGTLPEGKADIVIALTHMGSAQEKDGKITGEVVDSGLCKVESIDAIISAHTHLTVSGTVNGKPVVQANYAGRALANLSIVVDASGKVLSITPKVDNISARKSQLISDDNAKNTYNNYNNELKPILDEVVGITDTELTHDRFVEGTSILGQWTTDVMRKAVGVQIGITNGGGLRTPISSGEITMGTLYTVMPFDNTLVKLSLTGSGIKKVIENGIANNSVGWVQVSGVKVYYDIKAAAGNRITAMFLEDGTPIEMDKTYTVVTNDFMYTGGDLYDFKGATNVIDTGIPIRDSLATALKALNGKHLVVTDSKPLINGVAPSQNVVTLANTDQKLPKTGSIIDGDVMINLGFITIVIGFAMIGISRKKKNAA